MIRIAITAAAYHAIRSPLPEDAPLWPLQRQGGQWLHPPSRRLSSTVCGPSGGPARAIATSSCGMRFRIGGRQIGTRCQFEMSKFAAHRAGRALGGGDGLEPPRKPVDGHLGRDDVGPCGSSDDVASAHKKAKRTEKVNNGNAARASLGRRT